MDRREVPLRAVLYQYGIATIAGLGAMAAGAWLAWPSAAIGPLLSGDRCCRLSAGQVSTAVAMMDLGNVVTPLPTSYLMDLGGRKPALFVTAFLYLLASLLVLVAADPWYLYAARFLAGMAKGVVFAVVPIYLGEVATVNIRGALSTMFIGFLNIGMFYDYICGALLSYDHLNVANAVIPVVFAVTFLFVPESPYYLTMKHKERKAIKCLAKYRQVGEADEGLLAEAKAVSLTVQKDLEQRGRFFDIFGSRSMRRATTIAGLLALFQRGSGISPTLAYSTITLPSGGGGAIGAPIYMVVFSAILVLANYLAAPLIDTWGRRILLLCSAAGTALVQLCAGLYYFMEARGYEVASWRWVPYLCLLLFAVTYSLGIGFVPSTLVGEMFPTNVKCYASSVSAIILAATSFVVNRIFREVADAWGVEYMYLFFTINCVACAWFCYYYVFETKGKTFAEIQLVLQVKSGETHE